MEGAEFLTAEDMPSQAPSLEDFQELHGHVSFLVRKLIRVVSWPAAAPAITTATTVRPEQGPKPSKSDTFSSISLIRQGKWFSNSMPFCKEAVLYSKEHGK